ncbi:pre-rRNA 2'-O-ribose RNA methyltransferase FTSJ3-like [Argiope bruennichi]|uniref:pre-rRNA 2'-O-ribose RNA methyltransferase FTSJ3-like n=1 Tax=Argiope bruennichi TaxID=94029 RepID=UPI0024944FDD|nr:pre-rRNA 2'-O-ribose RNA methyltransferase FTSJ3-like [Argiope bruennichi]
MPKKAKVGKQRKDKFYKLAKETGYRSRASFKLLQLNRKFEFLPKSRVLIDLCAAPGGWLQVAQQAMPVSSVIIGVDLVPIKTIPNVITLQEDITTDKCRQSLKRQLKTWKADVVLHDGAPNVGKNWIQDAFTQNGLTLSALKLATEMLVKGGWFVTKVFRSKDYLSLVWIFKKLFKHVHVTKPQASRNESAEIFVVCQGFLAPERLDPRFLDPGYLFKDVQSKEETKSKLLELTNKKPKAEGYEDDAPMYRTLNATDFIFCENHLERLSKCNEVVFDDEDIKNHKLTTEEIKQCCKDIKVLGKADLKMLLNWRKQLRTILEEAAKKEEKTLAVEKVAPDEEEELDGVMKEVEELELSKLQEAKRKKKKILKERKKLHERLNLKMIIKDDEPIIDEDRELFKLSQIKNKNALLQVEDETNLEFGLEAPQPADEDILQPGYKSTFISYNRDVRDDSRVEAEPEKEESEYSSDEGLSSELEFESESEQEDDKEVTETILEGKKNPLMVDLVERPDRVKDTVDRWFDKADFASENDDSDLELDLLAEEFEKKQKAKKDEMDKEPISEEQKDDSTSQSAKETNTDKKEKKRKRVKLDPEGLALGSLIVQSKKMKRDIIESGYNRYASNDEKLPDWFVRDEKKHYRKQLPVSAELVAEYKQRLKEINARPIKKIVEAKARKKRRSIRRMEKAKKRAEKVTDHPDMSLSEKADQLKEIYKRAVPKQDHKVTYVVAKKGAGRRVSRPAGVKGRFKVVDPRMKKDTRKEKIAMKKEKKNKKSFKRNSKSKAQKKR